MGTVCQTLRNVGVKTHFWHLAFLSNYIFADLSQEDLCGFIVIMHERDLKSIHLVWLTKFDIFNNNHDLWKSTKDFEIQIRDHPFFSTDFKIRITFGLGWVGRLQPNSGFVCSDFGDGWVGQQKSEHCSDFEIRWKNGQSLLCTLIN